MISSCPSAQGAEGDIPHASKHPPAPATSWKISGKARLVTWLGLEEVIYLVYWFYVWVFCKYRPNQNLETHLEPLQSLFIWYCALIMFWKRKIYRSLHFQPGHWDMKKEKTSLKIHKNYISKCDFMWRNVTKLRPSHAARLFLHIFVLINCRNFIF